MRCEPVVEFEDGARQPTPIHTADGVHVVQSPKQDKIVDTVVANREDCTKMASDINVVVDANKSTIAMAKDAKGKGKKLPASAQQHMMDGARKMMGSLDKCGRDEKVGAAFARIDLGGRR